MAFIKGASGNPGGRPKAVKAVEDAAKVHTTDAIATLATLMVAVDIDPRARIAAAIALLDRAHGKPKQSMALDATLKGDFGAVLADAWARAKTPKQ